MPTSQKQPETTSSAPTRRKPRKTRHYVRLRRSGPNGVEGLHQYFVYGRLYRRDGVYAVDGDMRRKLMATQKFEEIHEADLDRAKAEAKTPRGIALQQRINQERRQARKMKHNQGVMEDDGGLDEVIEDDGGDEVAV